MPSHFQIALHINGLLMEVGKDAAIPGQDSLTSKFPTATYISCKIVYFIILYYSLKCISNSTLLIIIQIAFNSIDCYITKSVSGPNMLGLKWIIEPDPVTNQVIIFSSKPPPFIPDYTVSNIFWIGLLTPMGIWLGLSIVSLFNGNMANFCYQLISAGVNIVNFIMFMKAHIQTQNEGVKAAKIAMYDNNVNFELVSDSEDDDDEKEV